MCKIEQVFFIRNYLLSENIFLSDEKIIEELHSIKYFSYDVSSKRKVKEKIVSIILRKLQFNLPQKKRK